ncbi:MAG: TIGR00725 family protein [Candidatus Altiarchaeales archaeon IMC4]|nr:MAG: TIGR00725 family protein [Candidatus Altiarchaeales archaeon IMC4]
MVTRIGVIGRDGEIPEKIKDICEQIGAEIAKKDCILICGGRTGVMEAACRGAKKAGGVTVGILQSTDKNEANQYVDIPITTGMGKIRNALVVISSDVLIAINGRTGTLSEIAIALNHGKPVVMVNGTSCVGEPLKDPNLFFADAKDAVGVALDLVK